MSLFLCLSSISLGRYCWKSLSKSGGFGKKIKPRAWPYRERSVYRRGDSNSLHTMVYSLVFPYCTSIFIWTQLISPVTFGYKLFPFSHYIRDFAWSMPTIMVTELNQIMHVEQSMMGSHCDGMMRSICWCLLASVKTSMYSFFNNQLIFLKFEKRNRDAFILRFTMISLCYTISIPVTTSKEVWNHFFTTIRMETKFTFTLYTDIYHHQDLGWIRFLIQCSASRLLPSCAVSSLINVFKLFYFTLFSILPNTDISKY